MATSDKTGIFGEVEITGRRRLSCSHIDDDLARIENCDSAGALKELLLRFYPDLTPESSLDVFSFSFRPSPLDILASGGTSNACDHDYVVVNKPAPLICHASEYKTADERPLFKRVRDQLDMRVNLVHRLDRGASGCVLLCINTSSPSHTSRLVEMLQEGQKTYLAWCRGNGDYLRMLGSGERTTYKLPGEEGKICDVETLGDGWFRVDRAIKNERGSLKESITDFRFIVGSHDNFIVECRPHTGRWHQIRKHLSSLSVPILGDVSHGNSKVNKIWRTRGLPRNRIGLHLYRMDLPPIDDASGKSGIYCEAPIPPDLVDLWKKYNPDSMEVLPQRFGSNILLRTNETFT